MADELIIPNEPEVDDEQIQKVSNNSPSINDTLRLNELFNVNLPDYTTDSDIAIPRGATDYSEDIVSGRNTRSLVNKIHVIKLNSVPNRDVDIKQPLFVDSYNIKSASDLVQTVKGMVIYDIEDFLYCKWVGLPINRLITLRRFPVPVLDNIFDIYKSVKYKNGDKKGKQEKNKLNDVGDIARMVTYMTAETNKIEDILSLSYAMKWKQLTAEFDQMTMFGEQSGVSGYMKGLGAVFDKTTNSNYLSGRSTGGPMASYDPKFDQNRVYGPVDSIAETNIRDVGLEFNKEFEITFEYELRSINGRTPEYAMKDILANAIACTFNDGDFWGGARYWVGERPSPWAKKLQWMNSGNIDTVMKGMMSTLTNTLKKYFGSKESALQTLKNAVKGGFALAMGKLLDGLGRPGIPAMQSLLSSEPTGEWHLMVGNPHNPILSIGNLICTGTDIKFPTDSLSYGDFPTKLQIIVHLKPGMPKDRAGIETIFNHGTKRMYWQPSKQKVDKNSTGALPLVRTGKAVNQNVDNVDITRQLHGAYKFMPYVDPYIDDVDKAKIKNIDLEIGGVDATVKGELYDVYEKDTSDSKATEKAKENAAESKKESTEKDKQAETKKEESTEKDQNKVPDNNTANENNNNTGTNNNTSNSPNYIEQSSANAPKTEIIQRPSKPNPNDPKYMLNPDLYKTDLALYNADLNLYYKSNTGFPDRSDYPDGPDGDEAYDFAYYNWINTHR